MKKLWILTDSKCPQLYSDDKVLLPALEAQRIKGLPVIWDQFQPLNDMKILIRTPWDYPLKRKSFENLLNEIDRVEAQTINSTSIVRWNLNKEYLVELQKRNIPVLPTEIIRNFNSTFNWNEYSFPLVVKPLVGASGRDTFCIATQNQIPNLLNLFGQDVIIQPFAKLILTQGEYSLIFFNGEFSHAVLKQTGPKDFRVQLDHGGKVKKVEPSKILVNLAKDILKRLPHTYSYARLDFVEYKEQWVIIEVEVVEPELFFRFSPTAPAAFARHLATII